MTRLIAAAIMFTALSGCGAGESVGDLSPSDDNPAAPTQLAAPIENAAPIRPGLDSFLASPPPWAIDKRIGLITNVAGVDHRGRANLDLLAERIDFRLVALFAFEHGLRGDAPAGMKIASTTDAKTGLPVFSLYGDVREPTAEMLQDLDLLVYDVQDVGARPYTRVSTMALAMRAAGAKGIPFVVLDRPNPIGGTIVEGPVLDPTYASFVGMYPIPLRHGMTVGELARMYNERFELGATLHVVSVQGWRRDTCFDETGLPFLPPSPNIRRLEAALLYPGTVLVEGTNVSEGRGTEFPFEQAAAPWLQADDIASQLNAVGISGMRFEATRVDIATDARKFGGQSVPAVRLVVTDRRLFRPVRTAMLLIDAIRRRHPDEFAWVGGGSNRQGILMIDRLAGTDQFRKAVDNGTLADWLDEWDRQAEEFCSLREPFLLYE